MVQKNFGVKILEYRQNKGLTQEELAGRIGVTPQALSKWERGQSLPDIALLAELCQVLGCSADYLLGIDGTKITENDDKNAQNEILENLRNCIEPLELTFGEKLISIFMDNSYIEQVVQVRKDLSKMGILMPLVRVRDDLQLTQREFAIISYNKILYHEKLPDNTDDSCLYIMKCLKRTVKENYADILNRDLVKQMTENLGKKYPALISEVIPSRISYGLLTNVLKTFISEGNSCLYLVRMIEIMDDMICQKNSIPPEEFAAKCYSSLTIDDKNNKNH